MKKLLIGIFIVANAIQATAQDTKIRFFGHPGFDAMYNTKEKVGSPYFRSGPLIMFLTSQLNENISVSSEFNIHYQTSTGPDLELERLYLKYNYKDYLSFRFGKMYTPIGFWNLNYNFGLVLQPTISRPTLLQPTHDGGYITNRDVGLQIEGNGITKLGLFYKIMIMNGVGKNGGNLGIGYKLGETPAGIIQLGIEPTEGLKISGSFLGQQVQKGYPNQYGFIMNENVVSTLLSGSISFMNSDKKFELIAEGYSSTNHYKSVGNKSIQGGFLYVGYKASEKFVPYIYTEYVNVDQSENDKDGTGYYPTVNTYNQPFISTTKFDLGLRYKYSGNLVYKFEFETLEQDKFQLSPVDPESGGLSFGIKTQVAFSF